MEASAAPPTNSSGAEAAQLASRHTYLALGFTLLTIACLGSGLNTFILLTFRKRGQFNGTTFTLIKAVTWFDLLCSTFGMVMPIVSSFEQRWVFGEIGSTCNGLIMAWSGFTIIHLLVAISIDRYLAVVVPAKRAGLPPNCGRNTVAACASFALLWALLPLTGISSYQLEGLRISSSLDWQASGILDRTFLLVTFVIYFALPIFVMLVSYIKVFAVVVKTKKTLWRFMAQTFGRRRHLLEARIARCSLLVVASFLFVWSPYAVLSLHTVIGGEIDVSPLLSTIAAVTGKCSALLNALVYSFDTPQFRRAWRSTMEKGLTEQTEIERSAPAGRKKMSNFGHGYPPGELVELKQSERENRFDGANGGEIHNAENAAPSERSERDNENDGQAAHLLSPAQEGRRASQS